MNILLIAILVGLVAVLFAGRSNPGLRKLAPALAVLAIIAVGAKEVWKRKHPPLTELTVWDHAVGHALGREIARNHPGGGTVVVLDFSPGESLTAFSRARIEGLRSGWQADSFKAHVIDNAGVAEALGIGDGPLVLMPGMLGHNPCAKLLARYPNAVAAVSFIGLPTGPTAADASGLPPLYVLDLSPRTAADDPAPPLSVRALVRLRKQVDFAAPAPGGGPEEVFEARYELVTHER